MVFNNSVNANQPDIQVLSSAGVWSGIPYVDWTSFTPTLFGGTVAGVTTYTAQVGQYTRIGNLVIVHFFIQITAMTGTGDLTLGGLPFTVNNSIIARFGASSVVAGFPYPATRTCPFFNVLGGTTTAIWSVGGPAGGTDNLQAANVAGSASGSISYRI